MKLASIIVASLLAGLPAGCSFGDAPARTEQVAARVNGTEISVQALAKPTPQALEKVIERELLVQQALQQRLDRDPLVARQMEEARRQVLAQAWLDRTAARGARNPASEVSRFYAENPALFAQRRVYRYQELLVSIPAEKLDLVKGELSGARDLEEVAGWLKWRSLKVSPLASVTMAAEQLPLSYLPHLARMKAGDIA